MVNKGVVNYYVVTLKLNFWEENAYFTVTTKPPIT